MEFTHQGLLDFMNCPLKYKFKHINKLEIAEKSSRELFRESIHDTIKYFYKTIMEEDRIPKNEELRSYWGDIWLEGVDIKDILYNNKNERSIFTKRGYSLIQKFYQHNKYNPGTPIGVDVDYNINLDKYNIKGNIELIRSKNNRIEIIYFSTSRYLPSEFQNNNDLSYTLSSYAYRQIFNLKEDGLINYHLKTNKEISLNRSSQDIEKVMSTIDNIYSTIKQELFWQRMDYLCKQCPYQDYCTNWTGN